jgi:hypothetical protein
MTNITTGRNESRMLVGSAGHKLPENTDLTIIIIIIIIIIIHSTYNIHMPHINTIGLQSQI